MRRALTWAQQRTEERRNQVRQSQVASSTGRTSYDDDARRREGRSMANMDNLYSSLSSQAASGGRGRGTEPAYFGTYDEYDVLASSGAEGSLRRNLRALFRKVLGGNENANAGGSSDPISSILLGSSSWWWWSILAAATVVTVSRNAGGNSSSSFVTESSSESSSFRRPSFVYEHPYISSTYYTSTSSAKTLRETEKRILEEAASKKPRRAVTKTRLAIVRPFCAFDAEGLPSTFACWDSLIPCKTAFEDLGTSAQDVTGNRTTWNTLKDASADVFLFYSQTFADNPEAMKSVDTIIDKFNEPGGWSQCFDNIYAIEANIPAELDLYIPSAQEELYNWVNGPNRQYEAAFRIIQSGEWGHYDGFYLMEGDSIPVKTHWLDHILQAVEDNRPFAIMGAKYNGDKWDNFYESIPLSLLHHINGNAIYNTSHPLLERLVGQLEIEAPCPYNSIPYDYRMSQMVIEGALGIVPKLAPKIMLNEEGENITLSNNTEMFARWWDMYKDQNPFKETPVIHNYAATNLIPRHLGPEYVIHGAKLYSPWDPTKTDVTLVISEWFYDRVNHLLSHLDKTDHPYSKVIVMLPPDVMAHETYNMTVVDVVAHHRSAPDYMDLCEAPVTTEWFMITNSYHHVATHVDLMFVPGKLNPVSPFTPATYPFCFKFPYCKEAVNLAQRFNPGHDKVVQDFDMLYNTAERNKFCSEWKERFGEEGEDLYKHQQQRLLVRKNIVGPKGPTGTAYSAYLVREGKDKMYKFTDRSLYGARDPFIKIFSKEEKLDGMDEDERAKRVGILGYDNNTDCDCKALESKASCEGSPLGCVWRPLFESCRPPEMIDDGSPICPQTASPTMSPTIFYEFDETIEPTSPPTKPGGKSNTDPWYANLFRAREHERLQSSSASAPSSTTTEALEPDVAADVASELATSAPTPVVAFDVVSREHNDSVTSMDLGGGENRKLLAVENDANVGQNEEHGRRLDVASYDPVDFGSDGIQGTSTFQKRFLYFHSSSSNTKAPFMPFNLDDPNKFDMNPNPSTSENSFLSFDLKDPNKFDVKPERLLVSPLGITRNNGTSIRNALTTTTTLKSTTPKLTSTAAKRMTGTTTSTTIATSSSSSKFEYYTAPSSAPSKGIAKMEQTSCPTWGPSVVVRDSGHSSKPRRKSPFVDDFGDFPWWANSQGGENSLSTTTRRHSRKLLSSASQSYFEGGDPTVGHQRYNRAKTMSLSIGPIMPGERKLSHSSSSSHSNIVTTNYRDVHPFEGGGQGSGGPMEWMTAAEDGKMMLTGVYNNRDPYRSLRLRLVPVDIAESKNDTDDQIGLLLHEVLPAVEGIWSEALKVIPVNGRLQTGVGKCGDAVIPLDHRSVLDDGGNGGVADADAVIYVTTSSLSSNSEDDNEVFTVVATEICSFDQHMRPLVGNLRLRLPTSSSAYSNDDNSDNHSKFGELLERINILTDEVGRWLGASPHHFKNYRNPETGRPWGVGAPKNWTCVDGSVRSLGLPHVLQPRLPDPKVTSTSSGTINTKLTTPQKYEVISPTVLQVARNHFDCQSLTGAALGGLEENEDIAVDDGSCFGSQWDKRYFFDEVDDGAHRAFVLSPMTLALLEDSSWYRADYSVSTSSSFGHGAGCGFVEVGECFNGPRVSSAHESSHNATLSTKEEEHHHVEVPGNVFCRGDGKSPIRGCDHSHERIAACNPSSTSLGDCVPRAATPLVHCADAKIQSIVTTSPSLNDNSFLFEANNDLFRHLAFEVFGAHSKCFETKNLETDDIDAVCLEATCDEVHRRVEFVVEDTIYPCDYDGQRITHTFSTKSPTSQQDDKLEPEDGSVEPPQTVTVVCPRLAAICPDLVCPSSCSGRGLCDYCMEVPQCICDDPFDISPGCWGMSS